MYNLRAIASLTRFQALARALVVAAFAMSCSSAQPISRAADNGRGWDRVAMAAADVAANASAPSGDRDAAQLELALSVRQGGLPVSSLELLAAIARDADHGARDEAAAPMAELALELPHAAGVGGLLASYPKDALADALDRVSPRARDRAHYAIGRHLFEEGKWDLAIEALGRADGDELIRSQILIAVCHVRKRKSVPTNAVLLRAQAAAKASSHPDARRLLDLATLLRARLYYSAATRMDDEHRRVLVNGAKLGAALRFWSEIGDASEYAAEARRERAWGHLALGHYDSVLADVRAARALHPYMPEAELLEANVRWEKGDVEGARADFERLRERLTASRAALRQLIDEHTADPRREERFVALLIRANERADELTEPLAALLVDALADREMRDRLALERIIDRERRTVDGLPASFRAAAAGVAVQDALNRAHRAALGRLAEGVRAELEEEVAYLDVLLSQTPQLPAADERAR
jgi:hypothetical protein